MALQPIVLLPPPLTPPTCCRCNGQSLEDNASPSNPNGNQSRPYFKCASCGKFLVFNDDRGNLPNNPECHCCLSSKRQVAGRKKNRAIHYVCRVGRCNFYSAAVDPHGRQLCVANESLRNRLIELRLI